MKKNAQVFILFIALFSVTLFAQNDEAEFDLTPYELPEGFMPGDPKYLDYHLGEYGIKSDLDHDSIRFLWLRSFHPAILLEVQCDEASSAKFTASKWKDKEWTVYSEISMSRERHIDQLVRITTELGFFDLSNFDERQGLDGSTWIIELKHKQKHHWISRWSPKSDSVAWLIGTDLIGLSIDSPAVPIY